MASSETFNTNTAESVSEQYVTQYPLQLLTSSSNRSSLIAFTKYLRMLATQCNTLMLI